jgi:hypothetical protein
MNDKWKWMTAGRLRRGAVILAAAGVTVTAGLATAGSALAAVGTVPGGLLLASGGTTIVPPAGGLLTSQPTWGTTTECPTGFQGSADVELFQTNGTFVSIISSDVTGPTAPIPATQGQLDGTIGSILAFAGFSATAPGTVEFAVGCYSGAGSTGSVSYQGDLFISVASGATSYTTSTQGPSQTPTTTTVTVTPSRAASGGSETATASVTATDGTSPAGTVQFEQNGSNIGTAVAVNTGGVATPASTTFTAPTTTSSMTDAVTAVFTPTATTYASSTGTFSLLVQVTGTQTAGAIPVEVTVPNTGALTVTVSTTAISLTVGTGTPLTATGTLNTVSVSDTRNTLPAPGWSVSGQDTAFAGPSGSTPIPGDELGWTPTGTVSGGATLGSAVAPGANPGLADAAQTLASAAPGSGTGTDTLSANLLLDIPSGQGAGNYTSDHTGGVFAQVSFNRTLLVLIVLVAGLVVGVWQLRRWRRVRLGDTLVDVAEQARKETERRLLGQSGKSAEPQGKA